MAVSIPELISALAWDMQNPYHYVRTARDAVTQRPVLIVGGEDHRVGQDKDSEQRFSRLEGWLRERFPTAGDISSQWSGEVFEPSDGLGYIGQAPSDERVFFATGFSGNGMTYGGIAPELLADLMQGINHPFAELYDPRRKPSSVAALGRFARENLNTAGQYADWLGPADVSKAEQIPRGEGAENPPLSWTPEMAREYAWSGPWRKRRNDGSGERSRLSSRPRRCVFVASATGRSRRSRTTWISPRQLCASG
jgi:hypothetical protein